MPARTIYLIKRVEALSRTMLEAELRHLDLTPSQYTTLSLLAPHPEMTSSELARRVVVTPQSMSEMITALERKGLLKREENQNNRRMLHIALSPAGRALLALAEQRVDALEADLFAGLTQAELATARGAMERVLAQRRAALADPSR